MSYLELPTRNDVGAYRYTIQLEGTRYGLVFIFNDRMDRWIVSLRDSSDSVIIDGVPLALNVDLFGRFADSRKPPGQIFVYDTSNTFQETGRFDIAQRCLVVYKESTT